MRPISRTDRVDTPVNEVRPLESRIVATETLRRLRSAVLPIEPECDVLRYAD